MKYRMQPISTNGPNVDAQCGRSYMYRYVCFAIWTQASVWPSILCRSSKRVRPLARAGKDAISHTTSFLTPDCPNAPIIVGFLGHAQTRVGIIFCVQFIAFSSMEFDFDFSSIIQLWNVIKYFAKKNPLPLFFFFYILSSNVRTFTIGTQQPSDRWFKIVG